MKRNCPKNSCKSPYYYKDGFYFRANDSRKIQRFKCKACGTKFSASTGTLEFGQKKRRVNPLLLKLFCAKVTQKRAARIAGVNKTTVARKFDYWSNELQTSSDGERESEFAKGRSKSQVKIRALCEGAHYSGESSQVSDGQTD